jgi:hypothetical protein
MSDTLRVQGEPQDFLLYTSRDGHVHIQCRLENETIWLTQDLIARLFGVQRPAITKHLKNIFESCELDEKVVSSKMEQTTLHGAIEGKKQTHYVKFYNLDVIIAVGYRVNSYQATQFRIWATQTLKEFIIKGFVMDDDRLKQGKTLFGKDYFDELLERIREIRASERRFYQKITDIYALSADYDKNSPLTKDFFSTAQNTLHWAITGKTAAEIIYSEADSNKIYMGLTSWKQAPDGKILKSDVSIAKNYLNRAHIDELNQVVSGYLDLAELRAKRQIVTNMDEWVILLNDFLKLAQYPILKHKGQISVLDAKLKAEQEFEEYRIKQDVDYISDFDKEIKRLQGE